MPDERRRSDRLMLTIPLRVHGKEANETPFKEEARSVSLNRHGARIQIAHPLRRGQTVRLVNLISHREADFRVVGPVAPPTEKGGEWAVECLQSKDNIWAIQFPPSAEGQGADSKGLLECRKCHTVAVMSLSLVEVDVLQTSGILSKHCQNCDAATPCGYAEKQVAMEGPPGEAAMVAEAQAELRATVMGADQRRHRRVTLQLPILVRDYHGGVEIAKSENVSKGGFCFASDKGYLVGQGIMVVCPYNTNGENIEVRARMVRRREVEGSERKVYGVRYEPLSG